MVNEREAQGCFFFQDRRPGGGWRGGCLWNEKGDMKYLRLKLVLAYYLGEKGALMMKVDQVSGLGEIV